MFLRPFSYSGGPRVKGVLWIQKSIIMMPLLPNFTFLKTVKVLETSYQADSQRDACHLLENYGRCNCCTMLGDFPNSTDLPDEIARTIYPLGVSSSSSLKTRRGFISMQRNFPPLLSEWKRRINSERTSQFPNGISGKLP